jgi:hypothetical protein
VAVSEEVRKYLHQPTFDCHQWEDEEILLLLQQMYLDLDLTTKFDIELPTLRNFLYEVYKNYNEVPFHNFRHCFCVAQMVSVLLFFNLHDRHAAPTIGTRVRQTDCGPTRPLVHWYRGFFPEG